MSYIISDIKIEEGLSELLYPKYKKITGEEYRIIDIKEEIIEGGDKFMILTGDSGRGKTQSAKKILTMLHSEDDYIVFWCERKNLDLEKLQKEIEEVKKEKKIVVFFDGVNNLSDNIMGEVAKCIVQLREDNVSVIATTIKIPAAIYEINHIEFQAQVIDNEDRKTYLQGCKNSNSEKLMLILDSPILLRMVKDTNIQMNFSGYIYGMKSICQTKADVFWNYNMSFVPKKICQDEKEQKRRCFSFQFLTGIIADVMYTTRSNIIKKDDLMLIIQNNENGYIEYCLKKTELNEDWEQIETEVSECLTILKNQNIISLSEPFIEFSHDLYEAFYLALHEYNLTYWSINENVYIFSKVVLDNMVGKFYFELFDNTEIERLEKYAGIRFNDSRCNYTAIRANNVLSDIYYYGNGSSVKPYLQQAFDYSETSYKLGDGWATWNCVYLLKEMALLKKKNKEDEGEISALYEMGFEMLHTYIKRCKARNEKEYFAVYDMLAQYFQYGWIDSTKNDDERFSKAEKYLILAEEGNYVYSFNKHARLYEEDKIPLKEGEDKYAKAYELYQKAAQQGEMWAVSIVALYKWQLYDHINENVINKREAREKARKDLEASYQKVEEFTKLITLERRARYKNGYVNLCLIYTEMGEEEKNADKKIEYLTKAYTYCCIAHDIDTEQNQTDINVCLMLYYLQIRLGKKYDEHWVGIPLPDILNNGQVYREYLEREIMLGLDWGKRYHHKLYKIITFSNEMSKKSEGKEGLKDRAWDSSDYVNLVCNIIDLADQNMSVESIYQAALKESGIEEMIKKMVLHDKMVPGMVIVFGDEEQSKHIVCGNKQEVAMINGSLNEMAEDMEYDSLFDLASVTKIFTCVITMKLHELGEIDINQKIGEYDKRFKKIQDVTVKQLMDFTIPLETNSRIEQEASAEKAEKILFGIKVAEKCPKRRYSDMGALVLKYVIEAKMKKTFWELVEEHILTPCKMKNTYCNIPKEHKCKCVNNNYERKILDGKFICNCSTEKGVCHDPKVRVLKKDENSLQGHAGLFSTAEDIAKFAQCLIQEQIIHKPSMELIGQDYTGKITSEGSYRQFLGLLSYVKNPEQKESEVYHALSSHAFSMGGYTGNYLTIDFENKIFLFIGSNRCHNRITISESDEQKQLWDDGKYYICSKRFAWERDAIVHKILDLMIQLKFVKELKNPEIEAI